MKLRWNSRFKTIRTAIVLPLIFSFTAATMLLTSYVFMDSTKAITIVLEQLRHSVVSLVERDVDYRLDEAVQLIRLNATAYDRGILSSDDLYERERYFSTVLAQYSDVAMTYIGFPDGQFYGARRNKVGEIEVVRNNESTAGSSVYYATNDLGEGTEITQEFKNFDPRKRPWYQKAVEMGDISFGDLYSHFIFKEPTLTVSYPIYSDSGELIAVLGVDYLMTHIGDVLKTLPIGKHGQVFIVDGANQLMATTTDESLFKTVDEKSVNILADESVNPVIQATIKMTEKDMENLLPSLTIEGRKYLVGNNLYSRMGVNWKIYTVILENDFLSGSKQLLINTALGVVIFALLFITYALLFTRRLVRPIINLNQSAKQLLLRVYDHVPNEGRRDEIGQLTDSFNAMAEKLTDQVALLEEEVHLRTLELEEKNIRLKELSYVDELTGVPNRRKFDEFFEQALILASRNGRPIGLMMLDIDYFKKYNDLYGHLAGDKCLKSIGWVLRHCVHRHTDLIARYGGEEFVVVVQESTYEAVLQIAECIRREISEMVIIHEDSPTQYVTVSIGITYGVVEPQSTMNEYISQADEALYQAKDGGRNQVVVYKSSDNQGK